MIRANPLSRANRLPRLLFSALLLALAGGPLSGCAVVAVGAATTATMVSDPRTVGTQIDDTSLGLSVDGKLNALEKELAGSRVKAITYNGNVLLVGQTKTENQRALAEDAVRQVKGVKQIYNQIRLGHPIGFTTRSNDTWITTKIKSQYLENSTVDTARISVTTENGEVFLLGIIFRAQVDAATRIAQHTKGVTQVIRLLEFADK